MKSWLESKTIKYLAIGFAVTFLLQLAPMLKSHSIDWWTLGSEFAVAAAAILVRMYQPDIQAPVDWLNKNNDPLGKN